MRTGGIVLLSLETVTYLKSTTATLLNERSSLRASVPSTSAACIRTYAGRPECKTLRPGISITLPAFRARSFVAADLLTPLSRRTTRPTALRPRFNSRLKPRKHHKRVMIAIKPRTPNAMGSVINHLLTRVYSFTLGQNKFSIQQSP
jgi:hypothetical protein